MKSGVRAFTAIEALLALSIGLLILPLFYQCLQLVNGTNYKQIEQMELVIGVQQLRLYLASGTISEVQSEYLVYQQKRENYTLMLRDENLTLTPGNLVFLSEVEQVSFYQKDAFVCMRIVKGEQEYDIWLGFV